MPVFNTDLGRVAIMLNDEVRIPEVSDIYSLKRADLILIPAMYNQQGYGGKVNIPAGIVPNSSNNGMFIWYDIAKYAQAYTLVANYINGVHHDIGQSAVYSLVPEDGYSAPVISPNIENAFLVNFTTHFNDTLWQNQQRLIIGRRSDLALPLTIDMQSTCFKLWQRNSISSGQCGK